MKMELSIWANSYLRIGEKANKPWTQYRRTWTLVNQNMSHKIKCDLKWGEVNLNSNHTSLQFNQKDRVEDIQIWLNKLEPTNNSDSSTSFNSIHSIKTLKIKSINITVSQFNIDNGINSIMLLLLKLMFFVFKKTEELFAWNIHLKLKETFFIVLT